MEVFVARDVSKDYRKYENPTIFSILQFLAVINGVNLAIFKDNRCDWKACPL